MCCCPPAPPWRTAAPCNGQGFLGRQQYRVLQPVTVGPAPEVDPAEVVEGFLQAIASYAHGYAVAKQYLSNQARRRARWNPRLGGHGHQPAVRQAGQAQPPGAGRSVRPGERGRLGHRSAGGDRDRRGSVPGQPGPVALDLDRHAEKDRRHLADHHPAQNPPPLYVSNFQRVYLPRNLYFLAPRRRPALVPDPIFVPLQATSVPGGRDPGEGTAEQPQPAGLAERRGRHRPGRGQAAGPGDLNAAPPRSTSAAPLRPRPARSSATSSPSSSRPWPARRTCSLRSPSPSSWSSTATRSGWPAGPAASRSRRTAANVPDPAPSPASFIRGRRPTRASGGPGCPG